MGLLDRIADTLDGLARDAETRAEERAIEEIDGAMGLAERGDLAAAEQRLREISERNPRLARAFKRLGDVRVRRGDDDGAADAYGRAVDLETADIDAWFELGEVLARLGRFEPARDALRRALTLSIDPAERGRAHAALGRLFGAHGAAGKAVRELGKAVRLLPGDHALAAAYGRALVGAGDAGAAEWLTNAALAPGADPRLIVDAADATAAPAEAERLLREALARTPEEVAIIATLSRHLTRAGAHEEARRLALDAIARAPESPAALAALRESYAAEGRWAEALAAAQRAAEVEAAGAKASSTRLPLEELLALALGARDRAALGALAAMKPDEARDEAEDDARATEAKRLAAARAALGRFLTNEADEADLITLASFAPDAASRSFVVEGLAPAAAPAGNLVALLGYAHALAARTPELWSLALPAARATEAYDRPLLVAVMGEFNAGKSSFVNALCGEEIAPVGVTPTTATINILRHGPKGGRAIYNDGQARELDGASVAPFLRGLGADEAAAIRVVEIFHPLEVLRRVEVVDTPGLNSLRPEHESVARDFLVDADAIVWLFAVGQAAKATEKQALGLAQAAGKRVLGVLNKIDRASDEEVAQVSAHVGQSLGDLVEGIIPISARRALEAKRRGAGAAAGPKGKGKSSADGSGDGDGGFAALEAALEQRFFQHARALKRKTALGALRRFVVEARAKTSVPAAPAATATATAAAPAAARDFAAERVALTAAEHRVRGALGGERVALRARIDEAYRTAAFEVREFVRPRSWLFGEHRAEAADEEFLIDLLDEAIGRATEQTRVVLATSASPGVGTPPPPGFVEAFGRACDRAIERFRAYARGVLEGGAVAEFFRHDLPRIRLDLGAIRGALARRAPDPEEALFHVLDREVRALLRATRRDLERAEAAAAIGALVRRERVDRPLEELARAVDALANDRDH
jgi:tetratricopeptide (TPR) repeat protein/GTP-binding protein EngB required for normal cell division